MSVSDGVVGLIFFIIFIFGICYLLYKFAEKQERRRVIKPCWLPEEEKDLKTWVQRIYMAENEEALKQVTNEAIRSIPRHRVFFSAARKDRYTTLQPNACQSFEEEEKMVRTIWLIQFIVFFCLTLISSINNYFILNCGESKAYTYFVGYIIGFSFIKGIQYYCGFKKKGTKILTLLLLATVIWHAVWLYRMPWQQFTAWTTLWPLLWPLGRWMIYLVANYRLLKTNMAVKTHQQLHYLKEGVPVYEREIQPNFAVSQ